MLFGGLAFLRPHEHIYGGQDPGVYLNNAATYFAKGALIFDDPLLKEVPVAMRPAFISGYGTDKVVNAGLSLEVKNLEQAQLGPWFQPLHAMVVGLPGALFGPRATLYVSPLFALFCGLVLARLAARLLPQKHVFTLTFFIFTLNPINLWHARCSRAEYTALFFLLAGLYLLLRAYKNQDRIGDITWHHSRWSSHPFSTLPPGPCLSCFVTRQIRI